MLRNFTPIGTLTLCIIAAFLLDLYVPIQIVITYPWTLIGVVGIVIGILQFVSAATLFYRHKTDIRPSGRPSKLLDTGPYRYSRNPIYAANIMVLTGVCIFLGSASPFIVIPLYFTLVNTLVIPFEEATLRSIFTEQYADYAKRVRRWL